MFRSISVSTCGRFSRMNASGAVNPSKFNDGQLDARLKSGSTRSAPFGGFIEIDNLIGVSKVKLLGISSICSDEEGLVQSYVIPRNHYVLGVYLEHKFFVALVNGEIKHQLEKPYDQDGKNNVVSLF